MSILIHNIRKRTSVDNKNSFSLQHSILECEECDKYYRVVKIINGGNFKKIYKDKVGIFTINDGAFGFSFEETIGVLLRGLDDDIKSRKRFIKECKAYKDVAISITKHRLDKLKLFFNQLPKEVVKFIRRSNNTVKVHNLKQAVFDVKGQKILGLQHSLYECEEYESYYRIIDVIVGVDWFGNIGKNQIGVFTFGDGTFAFSLEEAIRAMVIAMDNDIERHLRYIDECMAYKDAVWALAIDESNFSKTVESK
ncbi:hypothetical protein [Selenomonas sp. FC4001]|uniref:hypothetical protein n=1 Tax=Selenomonas sp. FC4001 TaxID=1408313 RepID=UPI0005687D4C|nr:hypothetical protein [Selenomonas sp. FC4001]